MSKHHLTISTYNDFLERVCFLKNENNEKQIVSFLRSLENLSESSFCDTSYFCIDYSTRKYILLKGNVQQTTGTNTFEFVYGGVDLIVNLFHKDDFAIYNKNIFPFFLNSIKKINCEELSNYVFSYNFRIRREDGAYNSVVQRSRYITSEPGKLPLYCFGTLNNITPFKKDTAITMVVDKFENTKNSSQFTNLVSQTYFPGIEEAELTNKEKEVLLWLSEGFSSKQIANKMFLSENTISNHRINILRKTNCRNVAQLIKYAVEYGYL